MAKGYLHVEIDSSQASKQPGDPCGDVVAYNRAPSATIVVLADGMGHGIKANIAAQMSVARFMELIRQGYSIRKAFGNVVRTLEQVKGGELPYSVITAARIANDGIATILTYEMPPPVLVASRYAQVLTQRKSPMESALIGEANCHLEPNEGLLLVSDGITQAGIGSGLVNGWGSDGMSQFATTCLGDGIKSRDLPKRVIDEARSLWGRSLGDDISAVLARCRYGRTVNVLTGPPGDKGTDKAAVMKFMAMEGTKVVCGGTTAQIVAKCLGKELKIEDNPTSLMTPPRYSMEGIDLVTEGAITLNQVYNVLDEDPSSFSEESGVTMLHELLHSADKVNFLVGSAINPATKGIGFRQKGILTRQVIVPLLCKKLREAGKLVVSESLV